MSRRIPQDFVQELIARADIVEIVQRRVMLKKSGANYSACCPFHNEKSPSFTVSQQKQFYHCFGCGAHGNAIGFLMAYERLQFVEAVEELAHYLGIPIPETFSQTVSQQPQAPLYSLLEQIASYYQTQLQRAPQAQQYLASRGLDAQTLQQFSIGFAPAGWDHVLRQFGTSQERSAQLLQTGMLIKNEQGKLYDRFRGRIMVPIRDHRGRVIAFGGRTLGDDTPKYLNSPETPLFHKGSELFGLYEARQSKAGFHYCLMVEGYMDVIALHQFGITQAVATMGTATSSKHLQRIFRYTKNIIFCFDGDRAGQEAAWRALENSLPVLTEGVQIRFMFLPAEHDPDSMVRAEGAEAFRQRVAQAVPLSNFFFERLSRDVDLTTPDGKAKLVQLAREPLNKVPTGVFRDLLLQQFAALINMRQEALEQHLFGQSTPPPAVESPQLTLPAGAAAGALLPPLPLAIALLLQYPESAQHITLPEALHAADQPGISTLRALLEQLQTSPGLATGAILETWRDTKVAAQLGKLAAWQLITPAEGAKAELIGALQKVVTQIRQERIQMLTAKSNDGGLDAAEKQELLALLKQRH